MITLTKNKIIHTNGYNSKCDKYIKKEVPYLCGYLEDAVELSADFTLGDLFRHLAREITVVNTIFGSALGHFPVQLYIDDMEKFVIDEGDKLEYLQIQRFGERWEHLGEIDISIDFSGISLVEDINYAVEFTSLYVLKDLPLRLNKEFSISEMKIYSKLFRAYIRFRNKICWPLSGWDSEFSYTYIKGITYFTVYELISAVLSEISFAGDPEMRDRKIANIVEEIDDMKQELSNE